MSFYFILFFLFFPDAPRVEMALGKSISPGSIYEGGDVYFDCLVIASPKPKKILWFQDVSKQPMCTTHNEAQACIKFQYFTRWFERIAFSLSDFTDVIIGTFWNRKKKWQLGNSTWVFLVLQKRPRIYLMKWEADENSKAIFKWLRAPLWITYFLFQTLCLPSIQTYIFPSRRLVGSTN
jgi:hypothetical protein